VPRDAAIWRVDIPLDKIFVKDRVDPIDPKHVAELAKKIKDEGLISPIGVRTRAEEDGTYWLVYGLHRHGAVSGLHKKGGWPEGTIRAEDFGDISDAEAKIIEIDENAVRKNKQSAARKAIYTKARKAAWDTVQEERRRAGSPMESNYAKSTAEKTGEGESTVAKQLTHSKIEGVEQTVDTSLDRNEELNALAQLPAVVQKQLIDDAAKGEKVSAKKAVAERKKKPAPVQQSGTRVTMPAAPRKSEEDAREEEIARWQLSALSFGKLTATTFPDTKENIAKWSIPPRIDADDTFIICLSFLVDILPKVLAKTAKPKKKGKAA
jgi:ParB-like chromosome segregation protein Spo0J